MDGKFHMLNWKLWDGTSDAWDQALLRAEDYTVFQSFAWGEYKKRANWLPLRYCCADKSGKILGMAQLLVKKLPLGMVFIWVPGGPVFRFSSNIPGELTELVQNLVVQVRIDYPRSLIRFHSHVECNSELSYSFNKACLRPYFKLNSGYSVHFKLDQSMGQLRQNMTSKHRYYTKKAAGANISWTIGNGDKQLAELAMIHHEMVSDKQLPSIGTSLDELMSMRDVLGDKVMVLTGCLDNMPVTSCLVLLFGSKAFYMVASTGKRGRDVSAAYAMFEHLMQELTGRGITDFDFAGIDPVSVTAAGVNHFKCGFGGKLVEHLGEWEDGSSEAVRLALNVAIRYRGGRA